MLGQQLAQCITSGMVIYLKGDLGAGKTTLSRGILQSFGYTARVKSPTYTLVEPYALQAFQFYHFDLYRFSSADEWVDAGFREYFHAQSVCLVEWPEKGEGFLPPADIVIKLSIQDNSRKVLIDCRQESVYACLKKKIPSLG